MKKIFLPGRDLNPRPLCQSDNRFLIKLLPQNEKILTAYEVKLNHQYLLIFSVDFPFFGHFGFSIPQRSQKDPLYALAYFLIYFSWFLTVCNPFDLIQVYKNV